MLLLTCALLTVVAGVYVLTPLFRDPEGNLEMELLAETELDRLLNRKAVVYSNLKDLEFEYRMGRLGDEDFRRLEAGYKHEAGIILQKLDQLGVQDNIDEAIEKAVAARRKRLNHAGGGISESPGAAFSCPSCGAETLPGKPFCADCGQPLAGDGPQAGGRKPE